MKTSIIPLCSLRDLVNCQTVNTMESDVRLSEGNVFGLPPVHPVGEGGILPWGYGDGHTQDT